MNMNSDPTSRAWKTVARTGLRFTLRGSAWLLSASGRAMQFGGKQLSRCGEWLSQTTRDGNHAE